MILQQSNQSAVLNRSHVIHASSAFKTASNCLRVKCWRKKAWSEGREAQYR